MMLLDELRADIASLQTEFYKEYNACLNIYARCLHYSQSDDAMALSLGRGLESRTANLHIRQDEIKFKSNLLSSMVTSTKMHISATDTNGTNPIDLLCAYHHHCDSMLELLTAHPEHHYPTHLPEMFTCKPTLDGISAAHYWLNRSKLEDVLFQARLTLSIYTHYSYYSLFYYKAKASLPLNTFRQLQLFARTDALHLPEPKALSGSWLTIHRCKVKASSLFYLASRRIRSLDTSVPGNAFLHQALSGYLDFYSQQIHAFSTMQYHMIFTTIASKQLAGADYDLLKRAAILNGYAPIPTCE